MKNTIRQRTETNSRVVINPIISQLAGLFISASLFLVVFIIFENTIAESTRTIFRWILRIVIYYFTARLAIKFFKAGLGEIIPIGSYGIPRIFGKPQEGYLYGPGRYWDFPGQGNKPVVIDMRSESIDLKITVTTKDNLKMICPLNLNYYVYNPNVYAEVKDFKKTLESMLSQAFLDLSSETNAEDMLQLKKGDIREKIVEAIKDIEGSGFKIEDFGIEIQQATISAGDGFDFVDQKTREAFEAVTREEKQRISEQTEKNHFSKLAQELVDESKGKMTYNEAFNRIQQLYGRNAPKETVVRIPGLTEEAVGNVLSKIFKS